MVHPEMVDALQALSISNPEYLLFCPDNPELFDDIPRYLFRVFTPKSRGTTDKSWTRSMDATDRAFNSRVDIFARENKTQVASMLNRHLQWWKGDEDNLVSWTSSLLFALFPKAVFLRDMDLIKAYPSSNKELAKFRGLRETKEWYFGEYLSQGALKIEDKCRVVSAQAMIDRGLYDLRHEFKAFSRWSISPKPPWATRVVELRRILYEIDPLEKSNGKLRIILDIAEVFGSRWTLPMAANLGTLLPLSEEDIAIVGPFIAKTSTGSLTLYTMKYKLMRLDVDKEDFSPLKTKVGAWSRLPEVEQFGKIMREVYKGFCVEKLRNYIDKAETQLRLAVSFAMKQSLMHQDSVLLDSVNKAMEGRLEMEAAVNAQLREIVGGRAFHDCNISL